MKLVMFEAGNGPTAGALLPSGDLLNLAAAAERNKLDSAMFGSLLTLIQSGDPALDAAHALVARPADEALVAADKVQLLCPIKPPRLRDTLSFLEHMENGLERWARNLAAEEEDPDAAYTRLKSSGKYDLHPIFRKKIIYYNADHMSVSGPEDVIHWPVDSSYADFELELGCVIGRPVRNAGDEAAAAASIFGYTIYNDWSARDLQLDFMQANLGPAGGKDFAGSNTLGPCIVTADEIADPYNLRMTSRVNGETWTNGNTSSMHHRFTHGIIQFSRLEALAPGEVIGSGTVLNGCGYEQGRKLADGDIVELEIEGIGTLRNSVSMSA
jgi:2-keto-4-pentenoate hydratase/2-oxohepta-3-ene-1,7-dioic acid hydratase in catechol pathway